MSLKDYLLNAFVMEKETIDELLKIDNQIGCTNVEYLSLIGQLNFSKSFSLPSDRRFVFITDGEIDSVYQVFLDYAPYVDSIHINGRFLGMNRWLVERTKQYYLEQGIELSIRIEEDYRNYINCRQTIVLYGFDEFVDGMKELFAGQEILCIKK